MTAQVLFCNVFPEKDLHLNTVENEITELVSIASVSCVRTRKATSY